MPRPGVIVHTDSIPYAEAWRLQRELASARAAQRIPDVVWLLEHPPVYTIGRNGTRADLFLSDEQLALMGAEVHQIDRGGQMTWHGPGQSTVYAILDVRPHRKIRTVIDHFVDAMADTCTAVGVTDVVADHDTIGVYRDGRKLGAVGIRVQHGITTHGIALNRDPDLEWSALMTACGAPGVATTSIAAESGDPDRRRVEALLGSAFVERFDLDATPLTLCGLCGLAEITPPTHT